MFGPHEPLTKEQSEIVNIKLICNSPGGCGQDKDVASRAYAAILHIDRLNANDGAEEITDILHTNTPLGLAEIPTVAQSEKNVDVYEEYICPACNLGMTGGVDSKDAFAPYGI